MPSKRKQFNVRLHPESEALLPVLLERMRARHPGLTITRADVIRSALLALEKEYPAPGAGAGGAGKAKGKGARRKGRAEPDPPPGAPQGP
jgi:hypothetical protein